MFSANGSLGNAIRATLGSHSLTNDANAANASTEYFSLGLYFFNALMFLYFKSVLFRKQTIKEIFFYITFTQSRSVIFTALLHFIYLLTPRRRIYIYIYTPLYISALGVSYSFYF